MTEDEIRHIFVEIADGRGNHGSFLRSFAAAVLWADEHNFQLLLPAMKAIVIKYNLEYHLHNYEASK